MHAFTLKFNLIIVFLTCFENQVFIFRKNRTRSFMFFHASIQTVWSTAGCTGHCNKHPAKVIFGMKFTMKFTVKFTMKFTIKLTMIYKNKGTSGRT